MKKLAAGVVYAFLLMSPFRLNAQAAYSNQSVVYGHERQLSPANNVKDATAPGTGSRLIAEVSGKFERGHLQAQDSAVYTYAGTHGGDYEGSASMFPLKYSVATIYTADAGTSNYKLSTKKIQAFNALDQIISRTEQEWNGASWTDNDRTLYTYNPAGLNDTITAQLYNAIERAWENIYRITFVYNGRNQVVLAKYDAWNAGTDTYDAVELSSYSYAASTRTYLIQLYDPASRTYRNSTRYIYYYNGMAQTAEVHQHYTTGGWVNSDSTSMLLNADNLSTENNIYNWTTSRAQPMLHHSDNLFTENSINTLASWKKYGHYSITYNGAGKQATSLEENWNTTANAYAGVTRDALSYNSSNQRTTLFTYNLPSGTPSAHARYYYERYTTGVGNAVADDSRIDLYPIPAQQSINIAISFTGPQRISCMISDAAGRVLQEWQEDAGNDYRKQVSVAALPAGVYWLKVVSGNNQMRKSFSVLH